MYSGQTCHTGCSQTFKCTYPEFQFRVDGILDQYGYVCAAQCIGNLLYGKRTSGGAGSNPKQVNACIKSRLNVTGVCNLGRNSHSCFGFDLAQPLQCGNSGAFKVAGTCAWFPYSGTEHLYPL